MVRQIVLGDCIDRLMNDVEAGSVDLVYLDPPFFSNRQYEVIWKDRFETASFRDRWEGGIETYVSWLVDRLRLCHRVLKDTGVLVCHLDWHASHYIKVELDRLFGYSHFVNEIVWRRIQAPKGMNPTSFDVADDRLLVYRKGENYTFNVQYRPLDKYEVEKTFPSVDAAGRRYSTRPLIASNTQGGKSPMYEYKGFTPPRRWLMTEENLREIDRQGRIHWPEKEGGLPRQIQYADESKGKRIDTVWNDIKPIPSQSKERMGYPTQKPLALLERIIKTFTTNDSLILDPFCGCGTTIHAAHRLHRNWIGIDVSPVAVDLMRRRLVEHENLMAGRDFTIEGIPTSEDSLLEMNPTQFADWCCQRLGGTPNPVRVGDMGVDGWDRDGDPIQVKQHKKAIGRNVVDNFNAAIRREGKTKGSIVALSFGKGARGEAARLLREEGLEIVLVEATDLLSEQEKSFQEFLNNHDFGLGRWVS